MKIISIWSPKGGVGKTTLAAHLCDCLSVQHNKKVIAYDVDPQLALFSTAQKKGFGFDVVDQFPDEKPECDFFICDFRPTMLLDKNEKELLKISDHILAPVRASRLDLDSARKVHELADSNKIINVLSCYDQRITDQKSVKHELANDYDIVSYLSIYARTMNDYKTIYTRNNAQLHGTSRAKSEINKIALKLI